MNTVDAVAYYLLYCCKILEILYSRNFPGEISRNVRDTKQKNIHKNSIQFSNDTVQCNLIFRHIYFHILDSEWSEESIDFTMMFFLCRQLFDQNELVQVLEFIC